MAELPFDTMSVEEKLQAMERLWDDLCRRADALPTPPWHGDVLREREAGYQQGAETAEDWDAAKRRLTAKT